MEEIPRTPEHLEVMTLEEFHEEIARLKQEEQERYEQEGGGSIHLRGLDPHELTENDRAIYLKYKNDTITREEYETYRTGIAGLHLGARHSRSLFYQYIGNMLNIRWTQKAVEAMKKEKRL